MVYIWEPVSDPFDCAQDRLSGDSVRFLTFALLRQAQYIALSTLAQSACVYFDMLSINSRAMIIVIDCRLLP